MKPGRGIFCPFRVNPRIFSGPPTRLTLPPCPSALLPSLFALPALSSPSTFDPSAYVHLLRSFHLLPSSRTFSISLSFPVSCSFLVFSFHSSHLSFSYVFSFSSLSLPRCKILTIIDNLIIRISLHKSTLSRLLHLIIISCCYGKLPRVIKRYRNINTLLL